MSRNFEELTDQARAHRPKRVAIAAADDAELVELMQMAGRLGLAGGIFIGNEHRIRDLAHAGGLDLDAGAVHHELDERAAAWLAVDLVRRGSADILMRGRVSTANLLRAVLDPEAGLRTRRCLSEVVVFQVPGWERLMLLSDPGIQIYPGLQQKADMCCNAADVARAIGINRPKTVLLCALDYVNPDMTATVDADALARRNQEQHFVDGFLEGPLTLDSALGRIAPHKSSRSAIAGDADILIAPSLESAHVLYRSLVRIAGAESAVVLAGARAPIVMPSRVDDLRTNLHSIALAVLLAAAEKKEGPRPQLAGHGLG